MKLPLLIALGLAALVARADEDRLLWRGKYYDHPNIVKLDEKAQVATVVLDGREEKVPYKYFPRPMLEIAKSNPETTLSILERQAEDAKQETERLVAKMLKDPRNPKLVFGTVVSRISDDALLVRAEKIGDYPSAEGLVCLRGFPSASKFFDEDSIREIGAPDGEYKYTAAGGGQKVVRAYKFIGKN